jgi:hypothetical protein
MSESRLEGIVHVVVAKPLAWTLYVLWVAATWAGRGVVSFGSWARTRWIELRQGKVSSVSQMAGR